MDLVFNIRPLCLYQHHDTKDSLVDFPIKKDGKFACENKDGLYFDKMFYVVKERIAVTPPGMTLMCFKNSKQSTIDISTTYDPFHHQDCLRFYAWLSPAPYLTPLYIYKKDNVRYITFDGKIPDGYKPELYSPIYVLENKGDFEVIDGYPQFKFSGYNGRCIPDPKGLEIGKCMVTYGMEDNISLLKQLSRYQKEKTTDVFKEAGFIPGLIVVFIFILSTIFILYKKQILF